MGVNSDGAGGGVRFSAAGGAVFTDSLVDRAGPAVGGRVRQLLAAIGLEHVEAC